MSRPINPWKDFASYKSSDARYFKGREESIAKFLRIVDADTMSVLYASSGIGKTSFIQAGIVPVLIERGYAPIQILFTDDDFAEGVDLRMILKSHVEDEIKKHNENEDKTREEKKEQNEDYVTNKWKWDSLLDSRSEEIEQVIKSLDEKSLWWEFHTCEIKTESGLSLKPLLLLDQFEEVFVKAKARNIKLQLFFDELEELASNNLPFEVETVLNQLANQGVFLDLDTRHHYKIIFSLRREYLSDFDYWTNDRHSIAELQQNRMLLLPLSRTKAMKVIKEQPLNLDGSECYTTLNNIAEEILNVIDDKKRNEIEPFILSVLCSRLYDRTVGLGKTELKPEDLNTYSANTIIRDFYEQKMRSIIPKHSHITRIEEELIDEDGKRGRVKVKRLKDIKFEQRYKKELEDAHLIRIDNYNGEDYIELVHDRVADAIMERRKELTKKNRLIFARIASFVVIFSLFIFTYLMQMCPTSNEWAARTFPYLRYQEESDSYIDTIVVKKSGDYTVKEIRARDIIDVSNCPNLKSIHLYGYSVTVSVKCCKELENISFGPDCRRIDLAITDCPNLKPIHIPEYVDNIKFTSAPPNILTFSTEEHGKYIWKDKILWNTKDTAIVYARYDAETEITPPLSTLRDTLPYQPVFFTNSDKDSITLNYYDKYSNRKSIRVFKYSEILNLRDSICESTIDWDMSKFPNLLRVELPNTLRRIESETFKGCTKLESVLLPDSIRGIGRCAFMDCRSLRGVVFPSSLHNIADCAFYRCTAIKEIKFPDSVNVYFSAFDKCTNLETVYLPRVLSLRGEYSDFFIFKGCPYVKFNTDKFNHNYSREDDGTIVAINGYTVYPVLLINEVETHTYESGTFYHNDGKPIIRYYSKNGSLYYETGGSSILLDSPKNNIRQGFYAINVPKGTEIVNIPITRRKMLFYKAELDSCKEIHFPYPTLSVDHADLLNDIPIELKHNINLFVPYGALPNILQSKGINPNDWKDVQEESRISWFCIIFKYHLETGWDTISSWGIWPFIIIAVILLVLLLTYYLQKDAMSLITMKRYTKFSLYLLGTLLIGLFTWYTIYWFVYLALERLFVLDTPLEFWVQLIVSILFSICLAIIFVYTVLYSDGFSLKGFLTSCKRNYEVLKSGIEDIYILGKSFSWLSFVCSIKSILSKTNSIINNIFKSLIDLSHQKKKMIGFTFVVFVLAVGCYYINCNKKQSEIQNICNEIIKSDTITDYQIKELREKFIGAMTTSVRMVYPGSSKFKALGDSLFIIVDRDSCHFINFSDDMLYDDVNWGGDPMISIDISRFSLSNSGHFISYDSELSVYIWPINKLSQEPYIYRKQRYAKTMWLDNDKYGWWETDNGYAIFNSETEHIESRKCPSNSKFVGCIGEYLVLQNGNEYELYRLKDGKLLDKKVHNRNFGRNSSESYFYTHYLGSDSAFVCRVNDDKLLFDTIPHKCDYFYKKYITFEQDHSIYAYHVPTKQIHNLGHYEGTKSMDPLYAMCDGTHLAIYNFGDTLKCLKLFDDKRSYISYSDLEMSNHFFKKDVELFRIDADSLHKIGDLYGVNFEYGGWFCSLKNGNGFETYSLDDFNAGSYRGTRTIRSSILRGGWCFVASDDFSKLYNVKSIKLLIKESQLDNQIKEQLYNLIDKHYAENQ